MPWSCYFIAATEKQLPCSGICAGCNLWSSEWEIPLTFKDLPVNVNRAKVQFVPSLPSLRHLQTRLSYGWCLWDQGDKSERVDAETEELSDYTTNVSIAASFLPCTLLLHGRYLILLLATSTP